MALGRVGLYVGPRPAGKSARGSCGRNPLRSANIALLGRIKRLMYKITIVGAGSIGNHIANAARSRGWHVTLTDNDPAGAEAFEGEHLSHPLRRLGRGHRPERDRAPPSARRPTWCSSARRPTATSPWPWTCWKPPPPAHAGHREAALRTRPRRLRRPLGTRPGAGHPAWPSATTTRIGRNTVVAEELLAQGKLGEIATISARTREHWGGIFKAHPWLSGPADSYLGYLRRGGGAIGEHSHALNIWQHFAHGWAPGGWWRSAARWTWSSDGGAGIRPRVPHVPADRARVWSATSSRTWSPRPREGPAHPGHGTGSSTGCVNHSQRRRRGPGRARRTSRASRP